MNYKYMKPLDIQFHLLSGKPMKIDNLTIKPYTLSEIVDFGVNNYMYLMSFLSVTVDEMIEATMDLENRLLLESQKDKLKAFDFFIKIGGKDFTEKLLIGLAMIFKTDDVKIIGNQIAIDFEKNGYMYTNDEGDFVVVEENIYGLTDADLPLVNRDNFDDIIKIFKYQNYIEKIKPIEEAEFNPADDATKELYERMKKYEEKAKKSKGNDNDSEDINFFSIVSSVSSKSNSLNKLNIWDCTMYQLYDEYSRLELFDSYEVSVRAMMAGAKDVDIRHWASSLDE